jgi:hypothetical protein
MFFMQGSGTTDDSDSDNRNTAMFGSPGIWARIHTIFYRYGTLIPTTDLFSVILLVSVTLL